MGHYDKGILVPYLHDLVALHAVKTRLSLKIIPALLGMLCGLLMCVVGLICAVVVFDTRNDWVWYVDYCNSLGWPVTAEETREFMMETAFSVAVTLVLLVFGVLLFLKSRGKNKKHGKEMKRLDEIMTFAYDTNVIPMQYRNVRAVFYLYDWFASGVTGDLDIALNTMAHESEDRLSQLVSRLANDVLNQRKALVFQNRYAGAHSDGNIQRFVEISRKVDAFLSDPNCRF